MPTPTYTPLANITLGSSATEVNFSSVSGIYRDLILVIAEAPTGGNAFPSIQFNGDTGTNYFTVFMSGDGSTATSSSNNRTQLDSWVNSGGAGWVLKTSIMDYSATDKHKSVLTRTDNAAGSTDAFAGRWASTSAITAIRVFDRLGGSFRTGTTMALYGIAA
jgi:hypothetical protein